MSARGLLVVTTTAAVLVASTACTGAGSPGAGMTSRGGVSAGPLQRDTATLAADGFLPLPTHRFATPGVPDDQQPRVLVDPTGTELAFLDITGGGCPAERALQVVSQTDAELELQYTDTSIGVDQDCPASGLVLAFEVDLTSPMGTDTTVLLDLPWARADSTDDIPGRSVEDLDPGEVLVPTEQLHEWQARVLPDGSPRDEVFVDATGTRVRLRFAADTCTGTVLRPPRENDQQVYLDVVTPTATIPCTDRLHAEDLIVTLDAPLGDRQVLISEETRIP